MTTCGFCGGDVGTFSPRGNHFLCEVRSENGVATPCLGHKCPTCQGRGYLSNRHAVLINPSQRVIEQVWPTCQECNGKGYRAHD